MGHSYIIEWMQVIRTVSVKTVLIYAGYKNIYSYYQVL